jgi:alpha-beta hydrolase superfamily lysophospholipase
MGWVIRAAVLMCSVLAVALGTSGCGKDSPASSPKPTAMPGPELHSDFSGTGPGTLDSANTLSTLDRRLRAVTSIAARVTYTSTSGVDDGWTYVTGTVFAPMGQAPQGGWPVIALGHTTSGIRSDCAPSLSQTLLDLSPVVTVLVKTGYVVTVADYQGLGLAGTYHPYLDSRTAGYNLIDSVRAARKLVPDTSDRWLALGVSQGGQAAWAANELQRDYGKGLTLVGAVSLAPPLDLTPFADAAAAGQLTTDQKAALQLILAALKNAHPDLNLDNYRHGMVAAKWDVLSGCDVSDADRSKILDQIPADNLRPSSPDDVAALRAYLEKMSLPQSTTLAPMLVIYGGKDELTPSAWTDRALQKACAMGDVIDIQMQPNAGHDLDVTTTLAWIASRFKDEPVHNGCAELTDAHQPAGEGG